MTAATATGPARIAITGSSGLYGRALLRAIRRGLPGARVLGIDRGPAGAGMPDEFRQGDVRDRAIAGWLREFRADTVVHLAFAVDPGRDERTMHAVNVDGTRTVLGAAVAPGAGGLERHGLRRLARRPAAP
jgi:nucleoside-diphosphate-sugar epimerase